MISISKKLIILVLCVGILFTNVYGVVKPTSSFYVNDYAELLSDNTEQYIINVNTSLESQTGAQAVVVTVENLDEMAIEEYATTLFREFGVGDKTKNNGVLLLLALEERMFRIEVGYGLEGALNDSKTGRIQDEYIIPYLKENKWDEGIKNGFDAIIEEVCNEYNVTVTSDKPVLVGNSQEIDSGYAFMFVSSIMFGSVFGIFSQIKKKKILKWIVINILVTGGIGLLTGLMLSNFDNLFALVITSIVMGMFGFFMTFMRFSSRYGSGGRSGGFSGGGFSGGGGRSGGGGSSRSF